MAAFSRTSPAGATCRASDSRRSPTTTSGSAAEPPQRPEPGADRGAASRADGRGIDPPIYFGNRNWDPRSGPTRCARWPAAGVERVLALFTSAILLVLELPPVP